MAGKTSARRKQSPRQNQPLEQDEIVARRQSQRWTFLTNHSHVLVLLHDNPEIVLREVAMRVGITERAVQRIIQDLEADGFIQRERVGRRNRYTVKVDEPLRHPIESHRKIGDLLNLIQSED